MTTTLPSNELRMPVLGADMTEGTIVEWLVAPGDHVARGDIVAVVETDKADIEIETFENATIRELIVQPGERVPVGTPIATIEPDDEPDVERSRHRLAEPASVAATPTPARATDGSARVASPVIRHLADERHLDLAGVAGSGPGGRVTRDDVERASAMPADTPATTPERPVPRAPVGHGRRITPRARRAAAEAGLAANDLDALAAHGQVVTADDVDRYTATRRPPEPPAGIDPIRQRIGALMSRSWQEIPHFHLEQQLDLTGMLERLRSTNEERPIGDRILPVAPLLAAVASAARAVPECNGWWRDGFVSAERVDIGIVVSLRSGGIIVPTIERADELDVEALMARVRDLVGRSRRGRLRSSDVGTAGLTVTNLGDQGADAVFGVIHPPQVALIGLGATREVVVADGGEVRTGLAVRASLAGDHRAIDGLTGSRFLGEMQRAIDGLLGEEPT